MGRHFDDWLKTYMLYTRDSESPDEFHFWTGVSTIAGALRRRVWIDMRKFLWTPNFYIILVGPPGIVTKSTTTSVGYNLLRHVEGVHFGPDSATWQLLGDSLAESTEFMTWIDASGVERRTEMSCITINISELGTFLHSDDPKFLPFLIEMWDGKTRPFKHKTRQSSNFEINNPWLNFIACTTPHGLGEVLPKQAIGGGFASRVVFVYGDRKRHFIAYPDEVIQETEYFDLERRLVEDLQQIAALAGEYRLSKGARDWGRAWYEKHWTEGRSESMASDRYAGYLARKQTHMHKLAIILAASRSNELRLDAEHLETAHSILGLAEPHMLKAFESVGIVDEAKAVAEIVSFVRAHKVLTTNELWALVMNIMPRKEFNEALTAAVTGGLLSVTSKNGERAVQPKTAVAASLRA